MAAYAIAVIIVLASGALGQAICVAAGAREWRWTAPAVGLAALLAICSAAIQLPGRASTSAVVAGIAVLGSSAWLGRRLPIRLPAQALLVALAVLAVASIPFVATGRVGLPGVSLNDDTSVHLLWAEGLRSPVMAHLYPTAPGYPLGPHALVAGVAQATGGGMDTAFTGLLLAIPVICGLAALEALRRLARPLGAAAAVLIALPYLSAAYYGQGAFKETLQGTFVLAATAAFARWLGEAPGARRAGAVPLGVLVAGSVLTYSYLGLAWYGAGLGCWAALALGLARPAPRHVMPRLRAALPAVAVAGAVALVAVAPELPRVLSFFDQLSVSPAAGPGGIAKGNLGPLPVRISPYEALGIWPTRDFRFPPANGFHAGQLAALAVLAALIGAWGWVRRREPAVPAAVAGAALVYLVSEQGQSPYVVAKALAIMAPLTMLMILGGLLAPAEMGVRRGDRAIGQLVLAALFMGLAGYSTYQGLEGIPVGSSAQRDQLGRLRPLLRGPTLYLGSDDYAPWDLRGIPLAFISLEMGFKPALPFVLRGHRSYSYGEPLDFDSVEPGSLDRFRYVVRARSAYTSRPPENFHGIAATGLFSAWERRGPTAPRATLDTGGAPGATLDCRRSPAARALSRRRGVAWAWAAPPVVAGGISALVPGQAVTVPLRLGPGAWRLSLQYTSVVALQVQAAGRRWTLPADTGRPGPFFDVGTVVRPRGAAQVGVTIRARRPSALSSPSDVAYPGALAAVPARPGRLVPLAAACGRYVDWYRLTPAGRTPRGRPAAASRG